MYGVGRRIINIVIKGYKMSRDQGKKKKKYIYIYKTKRHCRDQTASKSWYFPIMLF